MGLMAQKYLLPVDRNVQCMSGGVTSHYSFKFSNCKILHFVIKVYSTLNGVI